MRECANARMKFETGNWKLDKPLCVSSETPWSAVASRGRMAWRDTAFLGYPKTLSSRGRATLSERAVLTTRAAMQCPAAGSETHALPASHALSSRGRATLSERAALTTRATMQCPAAGSETHALPCLAHACRHAVGRRSPSAPLTCLCQQ